MQNMALEMNLSETAFVRELEANSLSTGRLFIMVDFGFICCFIVAMLIINNCTIYCGSLQHI